VLHSFQYRGVRHVVLPRQTAVRRSFRQLLPDFGFLIKRQRVSTPQLFPLGLCAGQSCNCALDEQVALELATAANTVICSLPDGLVRSIPFSARQWTCTPINESFSTVPNASMVLRPSRSSFVTTSVSPSSSFCSSFAKPGRSARYAARNRLCNRVVLSAA